MKQFNWKKMISLALTTCLLLSCTACGGPDKSNASSSAADTAASAAAEASASAMMNTVGSVEAASMWLVKTEGTVAVTDGDGADVSLMDRLGLFSGYGVATRAASYGWINLDDTKLTKMDENSDVDIQKEGKHLTLTVNSGSLFFNVTKPLAEDETLNIRTSTMVTAIWGTCGWVEVTGTDHMNVYILEGTVECSTGDVTESVTAGQTAAIDAGASSITVKEFTVTAIPDFVMTDVTQDETLCTAILDSSGLDLLNSGEWDSTAILQETGYFGDPAASTMTADQAVQLGEALQQLVNESQAEYVTGSEPIGGDEFHCYAALFDAGDGSPAAVFLNNGVIPFDFSNGGSFPDYSGIIVMHFQNGQLVRMPNDGLNLLDLSNRYAMFSGYMTPEGAASDVIQYWVCDLTAGGMHGSIVSQASYDEFGPGGITIDGAAATQEQYSAWLSQWRNSDGGPTAAFNIGNGGFGMATGAQDAADLAAALLSSAEE